MSFSDNSYTTRFRGKASFRTIDLQCSECQYEEERSFDLRECSTDEEATAAMQVKCPNCDHDPMERVWRHAPSVGAGDPKSDKNLKRMQKNLKERFIKKELDDTRHKYGVLYDDSVRSAAAKRIAEDVKEDD